MTFIYNMHIPLFFLLIYFDFLSVSHSFYGLDPVFLFQVSTLKNVSFGIKDYIQPTIFLL